MHTSPGTAPRTPATTTTTTVAPGDPVARPRCLLLAILWYRRLPPDWPRGERRRPGRFPAEIANGISLMLRQHANQSRFWSGVNVYHAIPEKFTRNVATTLLPPIRFRKLFEDNTSLCECKGAFRANERANVCANSWCVNSEARRDCCVNKSAVYYSLLVTKTDTSNKWSKIERKNDKSYVPCDNSGKSHPRYSLASAKAWYRTLIFPIDQSEKKELMLRRL